jgi:hypothetical protein
MLAQKAEPERDSNWGVRDNSWTLRDGQWGVPCRTR